MMDTNSKKIVMVVDDSLLICKQIRAALSDTAIFICEAHTGQEAQELLGQYQPDLILLDVVLPDTDGYELFSRLKEADKNNASIIFLTSKDKDDDVVKGFNMGACDYIKKPFVKGELMSRVNTHLQLKQQKDELDRRNKELLTSMEKLNYMAFRDGLTGLYNRRYVIGDLVEDITKYTGKARKNVLILADIDDFKMVNDTYGHEAGDMALICIANIMEGICRDYKVVRWGGEEFLVALFNVTESEAFEVSETIRREVEDFEIAYGEDTFSCTITLGMHVYERHEGIEECVEKADQALYYGKRNGKNCSVWYENIEQAE
ncbi:diguanylate cyclase [Clostridium sp. D5]|uniref:diguanylate cyclase n=1 Tax=Clostridium sp. D5 TaxID=556261 RepID=UPI0001FC77E6|nr:GGDEF/response regulator receiver domain protein [Clostridium sp. D5]